MSETQFSELQSFVEAGVTRRGVPGVAIGLLHAGIEHPAAFGVTNVDNPLPVDAALKRLVLTPLGLEQSFLFPEEVMTHRYAAGHVGRRDGRMRVRRPHPSPDQVELGDG